MDIKAMQDLSYGMYVISTKMNDKNVGCFVNTVTQITAENPIITVSVNKSNYTNEALRVNKKFAVSVLPEKTEPSVISKFGFYSSRDVDKFEDMEYDVIDDVPVVKNNICGYMICEIINVVECETHDVFFARVLDAQKENDYKPMTYSYYHEVIKGKAPKKAPTYVEDSEKEIKVSVGGEEVYVCLVCGYVHKGPMADDFKCPVCGVDKSNFRKKE